MLSILYSRKIVALFDQRLKHNYLRIHEGASQTLPLAVVAQVLRKFFVGVRDCAMQYADEAQAHACIPEVC
jgi:hypothetical protein